jgi:hypothetical protein
MMNPSPLVTCDQASKLMVSSVAAEPRDNRNFYRDFRQGTADFAKFCDIFVGWIPHLESGTRDRRDISSWSRMCGMFEEGEELERLGEENLVFERGCGCCWMREDVFEDAVKEYTFDEKDSDMV